MTLATTPDQNPIDDDALSLEDCKRQVREKWRLTRQKGIDERLRADLQTIDDLLLRKLGDLDVAYQWMHDRPEFKPYSSVYDATNRGPVNIKASDPCRQFFMPEGHWVLLEEALMAMLEPELRDVHEDELNREERSYQISQVLDFAVRQCWFRCVLGTRRALAERNATSFLQIRECWADELISHIQGLTYRGDDETRIACVEPLAHETMLSPSSQRISISVSSTKQPKKRAAVMKRSNGEITPALTNQHNQQVNQINSRPLIRPPT